MRTSIEEEPQPDAFALSLRTHQVHPVVPVSGADERQAVFAEPEPPENRPHAVFIETGGFPGPGGQIVIGVFLRIDRASLDEGDGLVQDAGVSRGQDVAARRQRQPEIIVRAVRPHAPACGRVPPVLDIPFGKLTGRAKEQMLARQPRFGVDEGHHILQLVAETEGAAGLVVPAARPEAARQGLIQKPAVGQHVEGRIGCFHLDGAERVFPVLPHRLQRAPRRRRSPETMHQAAGGGGILLRAEREDDLPLLPVGKLKGGLNRGAGVQGGPDPAGEPRPAHRRRTRERAVAPQKLGPVAAQRPRRAVGVEKGGPVGKLRIVGVPRKERPACGVDFGHHVHGRFRSQIPQDPLDVARDGETAGSAGLVFDLEHRELDGRVRGHVHPRLGADAAFRVFEDAVAESVPGDVRRRPAAGQRHRGPEVAAFFIADVKGLPARIAHRVVVPGGEAKLVGILGPGVGGTALGQNGPEMRIRQDIHPRRRGHLTLARSK